MSQHEFKSTTEMTVEQANRDHIEGARQFATAPKNGPAAIDQYTGPRQHADHRPLVWSAAKYIPTPSLHEAVVKGVEGFEDFAGDPAMAQAVNAFSTATESLKKISEARDPLSRDTSKTDEQKLLLMATHADKSLERITLAFDRAHKSLSGLAKDLDASLNKPLEQQTSSALSVEIRSHVKSLPKDERDAFVNSAVARGDMQVLQSVLGAPSYLSGIADERKVMWLRQYREKADPTAVARLAMYRKTIDLIEQRPITLFLDEMERAMGGKFKDVRRLRGQVEASDKALAALRGE
jgi:hypothetical protein